MTLCFRKLTPLFGAEVTRDGKPLDLRQVHDRATLDAINAAMDEYTVLVFRQQPFTDAEQSEFGERLDGVKVSQVVGRFRADFRLSLMMVAVRRAAAMLLGSSLPSCCVRGDVAVIRESVDF